MRRAVASHILVPTEDEAATLKAKIDAGADFEAVAREHSKCPSGQTGGSLGEFGEGDMVPEFDAVVFGDLAVGTVSDPVKTQFGFHLIEVHERADDEDDD
ncbi:MAG: peptidylprolyl isomerase [Phycisphaerales bacterium]|nr:peptidylprolyl isomerase [Phycisphaerales bacterium]